FWDVIRKRHSTRKFADETISLESLSLILTAMNGITRIERGFPFRTVPSAGGLFPIETYVSINNVEKLDSGIYHYYLPKHELECIQKGNFKNLIAQACLGQAMAAKSALNFIWTAIIERSKWKYLQRCYRYIYLDAGHIGQNFYLAAESLGLGACTIGAIFDDDLNEILSIDGIQETALYVGVLGKK
ncbi:MAG: SagB/ThcOx family dehydrogenase, partial [Promethearchaeota archaeon]